MPSQTKPKRAGSALSANIKVPVRAAAALQEATGTEDLSSAARKVIRMMMKGQKNLQKAGLMK